MLSFEEKIRQAKERKEERSLDLAKKYDLAKSMYKNIYNADLEEFRKKINDPDWFNDERCKAAKEIKRKFEAAKAENEKLYDEEVAEAREEEKEEMFNLLDDLTTDWYLFDDDEEDEEDDEEDEEEKELEAI